MGRSCIEFFAQRISAVLVITDNLSIKLNNRRYSPSLLSSSLVRTVFCQGLHMKTHLELPYEYRSGFSRVCFFMNLP